MAVANQKQCMPQDAINSQPSHNPSVAITVIYQLNSPALGSAFSDLYREQRDKLVGFLMAKGQAREDAEDIAQVAFMRVQPLIDKGELRTPSAYLYQTASNLLVDQLRQKTIHRNYVNGEYHKFADSEAIEPLDCRTPERQLELEKQLQALTQALSALPINCSQALLWQRIKGYSYSEIAAAKQVSVSSVEKYIGQALKHCRLAIEQAESQP
ncbi:sigma-70 family RNA polymerase sigma factor [Dasania sp. GY-MA-18]|uniref:Sigma-70 family RNA polymerase sigma factor n=1 Tax=Dasania phycosphaerae TaxID=2950436 RepID=A0A9J6RK55_9GAMM|nr:MULTISPECIES: sigma-70 family RNA polymerase sigma factor [Dasania]MCR8922360.1 sigma-70 family RNA polymerase sigma factor [Dasania sp. GY-MA-18]MCZ0864788.1 sigma-70 family RNA polymerase sigma factor [Dasania phycosphaerae]MCZ0868516.1 sigma-70 family RNA polymerase sigma factor [Dasania phycosphaerae]